jgi:CDP-diacylglycerol--glycerol-3-phosphate 3-phosphatidyltransferase
MLTRKIGEVLRWVLYKIVHALAATGVHPNLLTFLGLVINIQAAVLFAAGRFQAAGGVMIFAGLFDMVDGRVARAQGRVTKFGAYFDSVIDRYSDLVLYLGLLIHYAGVSRYRYAVLVGVAMAGSVMVSYARARAESLIPECKAGFWERPERIVLLILGALANKMAPALWLLAVGPNITVIHRIVHTWKEAQAGHFVEVVPVNGSEKARDKTAEFAGRGKERGSDEEAQQAEEQEKQARAVGASEGLVPTVVRERSS